MRTTRPFVLTGLLAVALLGGAASPAPAAPAAGGEVTGQRLASSPALPPPAGEPAFALALLRALRAGRPGSGTLVASPASLEAALVMVELAARGDTERQLAAALAEPGLAPGTLAAELAGARGRLSAALARSGARLEEADALWARPGFAVSPTYARTLAATLGASLHRVDFAEPAVAARAIDAWASAATHDLVPALFSPGQLAPATRAALTDAVYLQAPWRRGFDPRLTRPGSFLLAGGGSARVPFMHATALPAQVAVSSGLTALELAYRGGRLDALFLVPRGPLSSFVAGLGTRQLARVLASLRPRQVDLSLPRLRLAWGADLVPALRSLGVRDAFLPGAAELGGLSADGRNDLVVSTVVQRAVLQLDERGTTAAAATGVGIVPTAVAPSLRVAVDRPFLLLVRDGTTGEILFEAVVSDPAG